LPNALALEIVINPKEIDLGDGLVFWVTLPEDESPEYPRSGLYLDGEEIYTVDVDDSWWWSALYFSDDAMNFFYLPASGGSKNSGHAIRFYEKGAMTQTYEVLSLLNGRESALIQPEPGTIGSFPMWDFPRQRYHDRDNNILRVTTAENAEITFDLSTGLILSNVANSETTFDLSPDPILPNDEEPTRSSYIPAILVGSGVALCAVVLVISVIVRSKRAK